jgi:hypothetical protein
MIHKPLSYLLNQKVGGVGSSKVAGKQQVKGVQAVGATPYLKF